MKPITMLNTVFYLFNFNQVPAQSGGYRNVLPFHYFVWQLPSCYGTTGKNPEHGHTCTVYYSTFLIFQRDNNEIKILNLSNSNPHMHIQYKTGMQSGLEIKANCMISCTSEDPTDSRQWQSTLCDNTNHRRILSSLKYAGVRHASCMHQSPHFRLLT